MYRYKKYVPLKYVDNFEISQFMTRNNFNIMAFKLYLNSHDKTQNLHFSSVCCLVAFNLNTWYKSESS